MRQKLDARRSSDPRMAIPAQGVPQVAAAGHRPHQAHHAEGEGPHGAASGRAGRLVDRGDDEGGAGDVAGVGAKKKPSPFTRFSALRLSVHRRRFAVASVSTPSSGSMR